jgi:enoyl-[acyl-carrier protein] reductase I
MGLAAAHKLSSQGMHICLVHRDRRSEMPRIEKEIADIKARGVKCISFNVNALKDPDRQEIITGLKENIRSGEGVKLLMHSIAKGNLKPLSPVLPAIDWAGLFRKHNLEAPSRAEIKSRNPEKKNLPGDDTVLSAEDYILTIQSMAISYYEWLQMIFQEKLFTKDALGLALTSEGNHRVWRYYGAVAAAKTSLEAISRSVAQEFGPYGLRSNIIQAGVTDTPSLQMIPGSDILKRNALLKNPLQRLTTTEDVANVVYILCLPEASWINGAIIPVDGGESLA